MKLAELIDLFPLGAEYESASKSIYNRLLINIRDMDYDPDTNTVSFWWRGSEEWQGHPGLIHGGIIGTLHDTAAGVLAMVLSLQTDQIAFTKTLSIEYQHPLFIGSRVRVISNIEDMGEREFLIKSVIIEEETDTVVSIARGVFKIKPFM
jgi:uncharacterized protein (TIGR00369 family)